MRRKILTLLFCCFLTLPLPGQAKTLTLPEAAWVGDLPAVKRLLRNSANVNVIDIFNKERPTPLHYAARAGHAAVVEYLLSMGAKLEALTHRTKLTPLHLAVTAGHLDVVKLLLAKGADPNARTAAKKTALTLAKQADNKKMVKLLESYGARE